MRDILRSAVKIGIATLASLLGWMVAGKIISVQLGAVGIGLFGLLRQLFQNLNVVATFNGQTTLVQGIASREGPLQGRFAGSVFRIQSYLGLGLAGVLLLGAPYLGPRLIPHPQSVALLRWLSLAVIASSAQTYVIGILNGYRKVDEIVSSQLVGPLVVVAAIIPIAWLVKIGHPAAYVMMFALPSAAVALVAYWHSRNLGIFPRAFAQPTNKSDAFYFLKMSGVLLATGVATTGATYFQSWLVAKRLGLEQAGQFWVAWTLSMTYVTLVLGSYGTYYMPTLAGLKDLEARKSLMRDYLRLSLLAMPVLVSLVILFKPWIVRLMFSAELLPSLKVMRWMLLGDFFKGISWVLAFPMLAFNEMRWFFWTEVILSLGMAGAIWICLLRGGSIEGLGMIFLGLYVIYLLLMTVYARVNHGFRWQVWELGGLVTGFVLVGVMSWLTWTDNSVRTGIVGVWLGLVIIYTTLFLLQWPGSTLFRLFKPRHGQ